MSSCANARSDVCDVCEQTQHYVDARGEPGELPDTSAPMQMILV
jgi:hypothetical protein